MVSAWLKRLVVLAVVFIMASYTSAAQLAYDGFNYTVPGGINTQSGGSGFSGPWTAVSGQGNPALATGSLTYASGNSSLITVGNKVAPSNTARSIRVFSSPIATANTTLWLSYRINQTDTGTLPSNHAGFSLFTNPDATGTEILFGKGTSWTNWGMLLSTGPSATKAGSVTAGDRNGFLLYKCVFTASTVTISMWVNPSFTEGSLGTAHATLPASAFTGTLACLRLSTGTNSVNYQFDEIRIGTTFSDVVPASTLIAYDGFSYTVPGGLNTQNGGSGFSGAWTAVGGQGNPALATGSLTYSSGGSSLVTAGNKVAPSNTARSIRVFSSPIATANTTLWLSYRINQTDTGTLPSNHAGFSLFTNPDATGTEILFGKGTSWTNWGMLLSTGGSATKAGSVTAADRNGMLVYKCVFTASTVTISMWVNPSFTEGSLGAAHATLPATNFTGSLACLRLSTGTNSVNYQFDEIRIGNTFTTVMPVATGGTFQPTDGPGLTAALNSANLGDTIILQAGTVYTAPSGGFVLPNKTSGSGYITIQSSNLGSLPATGVRVSLSNAANMPKIKPASYSQNAILAATSSHHYKLIGLEVIGTQSGTLESNADLIALGHNMNDGTQDQLSEVPNNIIIDRCIIRAESDTHRIKRGIGLNSASTDIINSYLTNFKHTGADSQAIAGFNGPGPFNIINNFLEGGGENVMFGGDDPRIPNLVPSDIVVQRNHFTKRLSWNRNMPATWDGITWVCKNVFELKNARNVLIESNIFEHSWQPSQDGFIIVFTPRNQGGTAPWSAVENVTFRNNICRNAGAGFSVLGIDNNHPSVQTNHVTIENNLVYGIGGSQWGAAITGRLFLITAPVDTLTVNHNTSFHTNIGILTQGSAPNTGFVFTNNIQAYNNIGVSAPAGTGSTGLNASYPGCVFMKNIWMNNSGLNLTNIFNQHTMGWSPANLAFPTSWGPNTIAPNGVLVNQASPGSNFAGYKVVTGSVYDNGATDGTDVGCNIDTVNAATAGCISGVWP